MEWIFAGSLPRGGSGGGQAPEAGASVHERLDHAAAKTETQRRAREKVRLQQQQQAELQRLRRSSAQVRESLTAREAALDVREGPLHRELPPQRAPAPATLAEKLWQGVSKTRERLTSGLGQIVLGRTELDSAALQELEELLLTADFGPQTTARLLKALESRLRRNELKDPARLQASLREEIERLMRRDDAPPNLCGKPPVVVLFAGVNGTGKTTTIGKIGAQHRAEGKRVLLAAGDTFRAAAVEQLAGWAERAGCDLFAKPAGSNASGVIYQALEKAVREGYDLVLCDTAGRLHTKSNLMEELKKIKRVMAKVVPEAPHETYLVLDANNGQNAIHQARDFHAAIGLTGLIVTKLDGTARGGVLVGIVNEFELPVRYVGVGEGVDDLRPFDSQAFAASLLD